MSKEQNKSATSPEAGFDALQEALKPLFQLARLVSRPEGNISIRQTLEDLDSYWRKEEQAFLKFAVTHKWLGLERHLTSEQLRLLIDVSEAKGPAGANELVPKMFTPEEIEEMTTPWSTIPYITARSQVIADATKAYRSGMYSLVIPALLPLAEGLAYETVGGARQKFDSVQRAAKSQKDQIDTDEQPWFDVMMKFLDDVYSWGDFTQPAPVGSFHRGLIIHGRSADYGTAENAVRSFLLLDTVAEFWQTKRRTKSSRKDAIE